MELKSDAFVDGGEIPEKYTCEGENISPPLKLTNVPEGTKSIVIIMNDPDIPDEIKDKKKILEWDHWILFNIPGNISEIPEGSIPEGAIQGINTGGDIGYGGPNPPDKEHRYFFRAYVLGSKLGLLEGCTRSEVENAMENHVLDICELMGTYNKKENRK